MSGYYWTELMEQKSDSERKVYECYFKGVNTLMTGKPLLEFSEEELYYGIINGTVLKKDILKPLPKYIKMAYINLCILIRDKNGLTTDFLRTKTKRRK